MSWLIHDPVSRFVAQLVVIIGVARVLGLLARKVGQPAVVAEIVGGILLGPSILGALAPSFAVALFPPGSLEPLRAASQLGVVLFVFLVGLELEPAMVRGRARAALTIAVVGIAAPFALGAAAALPINSLVADEPPTLGLALFLGAAMAVTAFPVLARMLAEHRLLRTRIGALAITAAALQDVIAWCLLAFVVAFARSSGVVQAAATTGLALVFVAVMLLLVRALLERLVDRINAPLTLTHDVVALLLLGALGSAWVSQRIGVHLVFGAFLFGAVIPKRDGFAHALAEKLEDVVTVLFMPLFFVVSGLRTHVELVASANHALACAAIVAVACAGKLGATTLVGRATGLRWREASALGILMNTRGLMELIVLNVGLELGVFSATMFSMMVVMVLATTVITAPVLARVYPPRDAIRDLLASESGATPAREIASRILACISHPRVGPAMVAMAGALGGEGTEIVALHLTREGDRIDADGSEVLAPALARADELGVAARGLSFVSANPAEDIVRVADLRDPELVLLGLHKPVLSQALLGGVVHAVLRHAENQVAIFVDRALAPTPGRVLVPFHGTGHDRAALRLATRVQRSTGAALTVLHVGRTADDPQVRGDVLAILAQTGARAEIETIAAGPPVDGVVGRAKDYDLVIVGVGREWGLRASRVGFGLGPERLIRDCSASLLVVRERLGELARAKVEA